MGDRLTSTQTEALHWLARGPLVRRHGRWCPTHNDSIRFREATVERLISDGLASTFHLPGGLVASATRAGRILADALSTKRSAS